MPIVLRKDGKVMRLASGLVLKADGDTSCCCGTCVACAASGTLGQPGYVPALICPPTFSIQMTISGITLFTTAQQKARDSWGDNRYVKWDDAAINTTVCCYLRGQGPTTCFGTFFTSTDPVASGYIEEPDGEGGFVYNVRVHLYATANFGALCDVTDGGATTGGVATFGVGGVIDPDGDGYVLGEAFGGSPTISRDCSLSATADSTLTSSSDVADDSTLVVGYGGSISAAVGCDYANCSICTGTSYSVSVATGAGYDGVGTSPAGSWTVLKFNPTAPGCIFTVDGPDDAGRNVRVTLTYDGTIGCYAVKGAMVSTGVATFSGVGKTCFGVGDPTGDFSTYLGGNGPDDTSPIKVLDIEVS